MSPLERSIRIVVLLLFVSLIGCDATEPESIRETEPIRPLSQAESKIISSDNDFGLGLFNRLSESEPEKNVFISPLSVSMALGMTLNGAEGSTREQMMATLQKQGLSEEAINGSYRSIIDLFSNLDPKVNLNLANSIWYRNGFEVLPAFLEVNKSSFDAEVAALDFSHEGSKDVINDWVDEKTNGLIDKIIDHIAEDVVMYLINAIYFKGDWTYQFEEEKTVNAPFNNRNNSRPDVPLMNLFGSVPYANTAEVSLIDLPYGDSLFSMTIILPHEDARLEEIAENLTTDSWDRWIASLEPTNLDVFLPRFKLEYEKKLKDVLAELGMSEAFEANAADFSRITPNQNLYLSNVVHKSFVEVNEKGTEAAAVTVVEVSVTSIGEEPASFRVDRPFLFAIREQHSGAILFIGKVLNL